MFKKLILKIIRFYQIFISPAIGCNCRFYPNCSRYSFEVIFKYGVIKGGWMSFKRIVKCNPWHSGGIDLP